jgi:AbrB family looped-hinge helix DNA binding protein
MLSRSTGEVVHMALYRTLYYGDMTVGVGGRVTIPQEIRDDLGLGDGDLMTVRVEESPDGTRQMVMWRAKEQSDDTEE